MARYIDADRIEIHEQLESFGNGKYEYCRIAYMDDIDAYRQRTLLMLLGAKIVCF